MGERDVLQGPRSPRWGCGACGESENWACRLRCLTCHKPAPSTTAAKARAADKRASTRAGSRDGARAKARPRSAWDDGPPRGASSSDAATIARLRRELEAVKKQTAEGAPTEAAEGEGSKGADPDAARSAQLRAVIQALEKGGHKDDCLLGSAREELASLNKRKSPATRLLAAQRKRASLDKRHERLTRELGEAQGEAAEAVVRVETLRAAIDECKAEQLANYEESREIVESNFPADQPVQLHDKLGIPKTFFQRPEIIAREQQITAAFQLVAELQALAATAAAADEARALLEHKRKDEARQEEADGPVDAKELEELMLAAFGEDMAVDGGGDAAARERVEQRRAAFREKLAAQLAKRRRHG